MQKIRLLTLAAAAAASLIALPAAAAPKVIASLTQPPGGLDCERAADEAKVVYDFQQPRSDVKQISVFINGEGVPQKDVEQEWPTVTVLHGLEPGRNSVELIAKGTDGKAISHKLVVMVGGRPRSGDKDTAIVDCIDRARVATREAESEPNDNSPWGEVLQSEDSLEDYDDDYDEVVDDVEYDGPSYVYYAYPSFGYVSYAPVYYYPWPYYYSNYYYPYHRHSYYYGGGYYYGRGGYHHGGGGQYYRSSPGRAYRGNGWNSTPHRYQPSGPPTHSGGGSAYRQYDAPRSYEAPRSSEAPRSYEAPRSAPSRSESHSGGRAYRGGGDRNPDRR